MSFNLHIPKSPRERAAWEEKIRRAPFLGYQQRWMADKARQKAMEKCRQAGVSWCDALDTLLETAGADWPFDAWVSSRDQIQAQLYGQDVAAWAKKVNVVAGELGESLLENADGRKVSALRLPLANGRSIWSLSSNVDAQAGKRGTRKMDEFALNPENRKLYAIGKPGTQWGGRVVIFSTHRGTANYFNELVTEIRHKGNPKHFSLHRVTILDAVADGLLIKLKEAWAKLDPEDPRLAWDEDTWLQAQRDECADEETWQQEYLCEPADDNSAFLSYDLIAGCEYRPEEPWQTDLADGKNPLFVGVDVGREHDLTVIWVVEKAGDVAFTRRVIALDRQTFEAQEAELYALLQLPMVRRCCIDCTGIGRQFSERAQRRFGYRVEAVNFTAAVKEELAYPVRAAFEDRTVRVPSDKFIRADLRAIRKETTASGNIRFTADRGKNGHADRFWALALALHAGKAAGAWIPAHACGHDSLRQRARRERMVFA